MSVNYWINQPAGGRTFEQVTAEPAALDEDTQPYVTPRKTLAAKQRYRLDTKGRQHDASEKSIYQMFLARQTTT